MEDMCNVNKLTTQGILLLVEEPKIHILETFLPMVVEMNLLAPEMDRTYTV